VLVGVERAYRLAEHLADAVARVGQRCHIRADRLLARIEADGVVRGGEDDALHALAPRRLEEVVAADDVGREDRLPRPFDGKAAEVEDAFAALDRLLDLTDVREIGGDERFVRAKVGRRLQVAEDELVMRLQQLSHARADAATRPGDQYPPHVVPPMVRPGLAEPVLQA
jgi:hypothetical protein